MNKKQEVSWKEHKAQAVFPGYIKLKEWEFSVAGQLDWGYRHYCLFLWEAVCVFQSFFIYILCYDIILLNTFCQSFISINIYSFPSSPPSHPPLDGTLATSPYQILPSGYWWSLLYATAVALLCLLVCLVGAHIYAKATFLIFLVVMFVLGTIFISFFAVRPRTIVLPSSASSNPTANGTGPAFPTTANFTGFKLDTLLGNLWGKVEEAVEEAAPKIVLSGCAYTYYVWSALFCQVTTIHSLKKGCQWIII